MTPTRDVKHGSQTVYVSSCFFLSKVILLEVKKKYERVKKITFFKSLRWVFTQQIQSVNSNPQRSGHVQFIACFKEKASTANAQIFHGLNSQIEFIEWKPYCR